VIDGGGAAGIGRDQKEENMKRNFKNLVTTSPDEVEDNDAFAIKIVAVAGFVNDWAAYYGPPEWSKEQVAQSGDKLVREQAEPLFYVMRRSGRSYRD